MNALTSNGVPALQRQSSRSRSLRRIAHEHQESRRQELIIILNELVRIPNEQPNRKQVEDHIGARMAIIM
jgi:hypothetical protein